MEDQIRSGLRFECVFVVLRNDRAVGSTLVA